MQNVAAERSGAAPRNCNSVCGCRRQVVGSGLMLVHLDALDADIQSRSLAGRWVLMETPLCTDGFVMLLRSGGF